VASLLRKPVKLHIAAAVEKEKKEKIKASKNELFTIIQSEFPQHIQFLSSSTVEAREQVVQQVAQRHSEIAKRLEDLKSLKAGKASVPAVSQDLAALTSLMLAMPSRRRWTGSTKPPLTKVLRWRQAFTARCPLSTFPPLACGGTTNSKLLCRVNALMMTQFRLENPVDISWHIVLAPDGEDIWQLPV